MYNAFPFRQYSLMCLILQDKTVTPLVLGKLPLNLTSYFEEVVNCMYLPFQLVFPDVLNITR
jgi:hypothetical protein